MYPRVRLLLCVFHLLQVWLHRRLKSWARPDGIGEAEFKEAKGYLTSEILALMCPRDGYHSLTRAEFDTRASRVSEVFWGLGDRLTALLWDEYVRMHDKWAPMERISAVIDAYGFAQDSNPPLPKLSKSDNSLERLVPPRIVDVHKN